MRVNTSDEPPEGISQNAVVPSEDTSEDSKRSITDRVKGFFKDERVVGAVIGVAALAAVALIKGQDSSEDTEDFELFPDHGAEDFEPRLGLGADDRPRRSSPVRHDVSGGPVKLGSGRQASETAKANSRRDTGRDPEPGFTYRQRSSRGVSSERIPV